MRGAFLARVFIILVGICGGAGCDDGGVTDPDPPESTFAGEWSGTTLQGTSIAFTVSADQTVTAITVAHDFNGCRGTQSFPGLSLPIAAPQGGGRMPTSSHPGFGFGSGPPEGPNYTQVTGTFSASRSATGTVAFLNFGSCGNTVTAWTATKR